MKSPPRTVLVWQTLFKWLAELPRPQWLKVPGIILVVLGIYGWACYVPFTQGWLPGAHWLAVAYDTIFPYIGFVLFVGIVFGWWVVAIALLVLILMGLLPAWRRARRIAVYLAALAILWVTLTVALAPALFVSYSYRHALVVEPWNTTYRTAYIAYRLDDNYGEVMLSECNRLGWCSQIYRRYTDFYSAQAAQLRYDPATDQLQALINPGGYVRSQDQQLCPNELNTSESCIYDFLK